MRTIFYNKFFSGISISFFVSYLLKQFFFSPLSFVYTLSFFGAFYLFLSWITYLKLDGVHFFKTKARNSTINKLDRFWYKKKGVYNMDSDDEISDNIELSENQKLKVTMFAYLCCAIVLFAASSLINI